MTEGRALLLAVMARYAGPGYRMTSLEIQKIANFLNVVGALPKLHFEKISSVHMLRTYIMYCK